MKTQPLSSGLRLAGASLLALVFAGSALSASAQTTTAQVSTEGSASSQWNTNPKYWERLLEERKAASGIQLGQSDWQVTGPVVNALKQRPLPANASRGKRFLNLPIVRLFVPRPMPTPPGGGRYFLWGESDRPWVAVAQGAPAGDPAVTHEAQSLISISR